MQEESNSLKQHSTSTVHIRWILTISPNSKSAAQKEQSLAESEHKWLTKSDTVYTGKWDI